MRNANQLDETLLALTHLICGEVDLSGGPVDVGKANQRWHKLEPKAFDGFEILDIGRDFAADDPTTYVLQADDAGDQPIWPIDVCAASRQVGEGWADGSWHFLRVRTLRPAEWRGRIQRFAPRMVVVSHLVSEPNGQSSTVRIPYSIIGGKAVPAQAILSGMRISNGAVGGVDPGWYGGGQSDPDDVAYGTGILRSVAGLSLRRHYLWSVLLGEGIGPRARFVTDPVGVREAFRLRDIPPGRARRAALLHWVRQHWRRRRDVSVDDRMWVREHLRGANEYSWNGLRCQIEPAAADLSRLEKGRQAP